MPCNTIQESRVSLDQKFSEPDLLKKALEASGFSVQVEADTLRFSRFNAGTRQSGTYVISSGKLTLPVSLSKPEEVNALKRAYSAEVVRATAKKMGWSLETGQENKFVVTKRSF